MTRTVASLSIVIGFVIVGVVSTVNAQTRDSFAGLAGDMSPAEVQQLFDAFELVRAQEMLDLSDEQYPDFVVRLKRLQEVRRRGLRDRQRQLRELRLLSSQLDVDDAILEERLATLKALELETTEAQRSAIDDIDAILNVRQQVRFRMFQQTMERRRLELLIRARRQPLRRPRDQAPQR